MTVNFRGYLFNDAGTAVSGATVALLETGTTTQEASTTTDSDGLWAFTESDQDRYDVKITSGSSVRYIRWDDQISLKEIDVRNNSAAGTPAATFTNLTNSASNQVAVFSGANSTKADNDEIYLSFKMHDSAGNLDEFARMTVVATDVTTTSEDGQIEFDVVKAGQLTKVWTITSSTSAAMSFDMNVDSFTIGAGGDSDITLTFDANSADGVITWMEDEDYFKFSDDILMNSTERINFYDTAIYIYSSTDGQLDLVADTEIQIAATTIDINGAVAFNGALTGITNITLSGTLSDGNYTFDTSGNVSGLGTIASGNITSTGTVQGTTITATTAFVPDASDGAALGTTSLEFSDLYLADGAVIGLGDDQDVTLTHVVDTGILLSSTDQFQFGDSGTFIHQSSDGVLTIEADTTVDINGAVALNGAITGATNITLSGELDAATLDISGNADIDGTLEADAITVDGTTLAEYIADTVGAMVTSNTESGITVAYQDGDNTLDFTIGTLNQDTTGTAAIATTVTITDNESTDEDNAVVFTAGGDVDGGNLGLESDGNLIYNPSTGRLTATQLGGTLVTAAQTNITSVGTIGTGVWQGTAIASGYIAADAITGAKIADDAIDSEHYTDGSIDTAHLAADAVTGAKIADDAIDSEHYTDGSIDTAHIADNQVTLAKMAGIARGKIIYGDASGDPAVLTAGGAGTVLYSDGTDIAYSKAIYATDITIGEDAQTKIDFETANEIHFDADNAEIVKIDSTGLNIVSGSLETATIDYTDGDVAITIADGGGITIAAGITSTAASNAFGELTLTGSAHFDSSPSDETVSGITATFTAGEDLERGEVVYFKAGDSKLWKAVATATGTMPVMAMAAADISADATGVFLLQGFLADNGTFPAYTVGGTLYAPEAEQSSQNVPEQAAPDSDGDFVQVLGFAVTANSVYFDPSNDVIEHA